MIPHLAQSDILEASYSTFCHFFDIFGVKNLPPSLTKAPIKSGNIEKSTGK